jgi:hypothetical protein
LIASPIRLPFSISAGRCGALHGRHQRRAGQRNGIPEATAIVLTAAKRAELDGLARSTRAEYRLRQRARIVLLAAEGMATRAITRTGWLHHRDGEQVTGAVRREAPGRSRRDRQGGAAPRYTAHTGKSLTQKPGSPISTANDRFRI